MGYSGTSEQVGPKSLLRVLESAEPRVRLPLAGARHGLRRPPRFTMACLRADGMASRSTPHGRVDRDREYSTCATAGTQWQCSTSPCLPCIVVAAPAWRFLSFSCARVWLSLHL